MGAGEPRGEDGLPGRDDRIPEGQQALVADADRGGPASSWSPAAAGEHGSGTIYLYAFLGPTTRINSFILEK